MSTYAVYEDESTGNRFVVEIDETIAPIHISFDDDTSGERVSVPFAAESIDDAVERACCFV